MAFSYWSLDGFTGWVGIINQKFTCKIYPRLFENLCCFSSSVDIESIKAIHLTDLSFQKHFKKHKDNECLQLY